ncbi:MAG: N-methyl-L-tryptophan oxidase [Pirellulales bacterium]|nr:N-methyl-L-tryptophan oxidase [Pirellulales bacterium]
MYDVIVLGIGGVGSAALSHLARRGVRVLGLDRFPPGHGRGSSHGRTRVIRQAYFEHPDYVPLLLRAYQLWRELAERLGMPLYREVGLLQVGPPEGEVVPGVRRAAQLHGLEIENFLAQEVMTEFPQFRIPSGWEGVLERRAGYLNVEDCVLAHLDDAQQNGAELKCGVAVHGWHAQSGGVVVEADAGEFQAAKLVVAAGAWAGALLADLGVRFEVLRKPLYWYPANNRSLQADCGCPTYLFETPRGIFYGFPQIDDDGVKVAQHSGGVPVADPLEVDRNLDAADQAAVERFLSEFVPGVGRPHLNHATCMYTMSPDANFVVDLHPQHPEVAFAAGLSGHGFKFACVLGEALADLTLAGRTELPIGFLGCRRRQLGIIR